MRRKEGKRDLDTSVEPLVLRIKRAIEAEIGIPVLVTQEDDSFFVTLTWNEDKEEKEEER